MSRLFRYTLDSLFGFEVAPFAALVRLSMFYTRKLAKKKSALVL